MNSRIWYKNSNTVVSNVLTWNYDAEEPDITISSSEVSEGEAVDASYVTFTFTSTKKLSNMAQDKVTIKNGSVYSFTEIDKKTYTVVVQSNDRTVDKTIELQIDSGKIQDNRRNSNKQSNVFAFIIQKIESFLKEPTEIASILEEDLGGINFTALDVDTTVFTNQMSVVLDTIEDSITENDTMSIPTIDGISNSRIFQCGGDQMLARNSGVKKVKIARQTFLLIAKRKRNWVIAVIFKLHHPILQYRLQITSQQRIKTLQHSTVQLDVDDYIEVVINEITYRVTKQEQVHLGLSEELGRLPPMMKEIVSPLMGIHSFLVPFLITDDSQDEDPNAEESTTVYPFIPCFREHSNSYQGWLHFSRTFRCIQTYTC